MQSKLFIFVGLPDNNIKVDLDLLMDVLNRRLSENKVSSQFIRNDELLLTRMDDVSFYVSLLNSENELNDWIQLAKDFELSIDLEKVNEQRLIEKYEYAKKSFPDLYNNSDYNLAKIIFDEMNSFPEMCIYSFQ